MQENFAKFCSTELHDAPLEGSTIFLYCSYLGHMSLESCRLAEWKYAIFSRTGCKTKKLLRSIFLSMAFKHELLEGSTILLQYSSITRTLSIRRVKICNFSRIGRNTEEQEHSKVQKNDIAQRAYMVTVLWTCSDRFGQVRIGMKYYFSSTASRTLSKFGLPLKPHAVF